MSSARSNCHLNLSPDNLSKLPREDIEIMSQVRSLVDKTRSKVAKLRENIDDRDDEILKQVELRKQAEERLHAHLVDMYPQTEVNEELHNRLPRSRKKERKLLKTGTPPESSKNDNMEESDDNKDQNDSDVASPLHRQRKESPNRNRDINDSPVSSRSGNKRRNRSHRSSTDSNDSSHHKSQNNNQSLPAPATAYPPMYPNPYMSGFMYPGYPGLHPMVTPPQVMPAYQSSPIVMAPVAHSTPNSQYVNMPQQSTPAGMQPNLIPSNESTPNIQKGSSILVQSTNDPSPSNNLGIRRHSNPYVPNNDEKQKLDPKSVTIIGNALDRQSWSQNSDHTSSLLAVRHGPEYSKQISLLLSELNAAKDLNKTLSNKLSEAEKENEMLHITARTKDVANEEQLASKAAALVEEIYRAQKERDMAMMSRIRLANEERDEAVDRLRHSDKQDPTLEYSDENTTADVEELLSDLSRANTSESIKKQGTSLVRRVQHAKHRKKEITAEEMRSILDEKEAFAIKCKRLENELLKVKRRESKYSTENEEIQTLKTQLHGVQHERDVSLSRVHKLEEELQQLKIYYSLHKSLSQEANMRDQFNNTLENVEVQMKLRDGLMNETHMENNQLLAELKRVSSKKEHIEFELEKFKNAHKETQEQNDKLERLVTVLRRKINQSGTKTED